LPVNGRQRLITILICRAWSDRLFASPRSLVIMVGLWTGRWSSLPGVRWYFVQVQALANPH